MDITRGSANAALSVAGGTAPSRATCRASARLVGQHDGELHRRSDDHESYRIGAARAKWQGDCVPSNANHLKATGEGRETRGEAVDEVAKLQCDVGEVLEIAALLAAVRMQGNPSLLDSYIGSAALCL